MAINVNPVSNYYSNYVPDYAAQRYNPAKQTSASAATAATNAYEQILALQAEDDILSADTTFANDNNSAVNDAALGDSDLLNLSPAALNILNGVNTTQPATGTSVTVTGEATVGAGGITATLTGEQQVQAAAIVAEFANQPLTQSTLTQIQNALTQAGINPEQVSIQDLFNAYTYSYAPGLAFNGQLFTENLASELVDS